MTGVLIFFALMLIPMTLIDRYASNSQDTICKKWEELALRNVDVKTADPEALASWGDCLDRASILRTRYVRGLFDSMAFVAMVFLSWRIDLLKKKQD